MSVCLCARCGKVFERNGPVKDGIACDECKRPAFSEAELYAEQMKQWFAEHAALREQLEGTIVFHERMKELNAAQLELHNKRIQLAMSEYDAWALMNGFPPIS